MMLSNEAARLLERYLEEMRASMPGAEREGVAEIEQDIRDHIEAELGDRHSAISAGDLDAVLRRLGSPRQWVAAAPAGSAAAVPRASGFEEWLAYAAIALLLIGLFAPPLIVVSWVVARWALARAEQRGEPLGAQRWLFYTPLALVSIAAVLFLLFWPFGAFAELGTIAAQKRGAVTTDRFPPAVTLAVTFGGLGLYWMIAGALAALGERVVRFLFHPFAERFRPRHAWWLCGAGAAVALVATAVFFGVR